MKLNQVPSNDPNSAYGRFYLLLSGQMGVRLPTGVDWLAAKSDHTHASVLPSFGIGEANKYLQVDPTGAFVEWDVTGSGVTDHGMLTGLLDDDHPQYHNDARGDIRYYTQAQITALLAPLAGLIADSHTHVNLVLLQTYTQTEANLADAVAKKHAHVNLALLETYTQTEANLATAVTNSHVAVTVVSGTGVTVGLAGQQVTVTLNNTAVAAGAYVLSSITVDAQGRVTSAANGYMERAIVTVVASKTLALSDRGTKQLCAAAGAIVITVPTNAAVAFPVGTEIDIFRNGAGSVTITPVSGAVTIRTAATLAITAQWRAAHLTKIAADEWEVIGAV